MGQHNRNPYTNNTLSKHDVPDGSVGVNLSSMSGLDHVTITELHSLGTLSSQLSRNNDLNTLSVGLHDETDNSIASTTDGKSSKQLELETLGLGLSAQTTVGNTFSVQLNGSISEVKTLLHNTGQFTDALSLLSKHILGTGGADDDLGTVRGGTNLNSGVSILSELAGEKLVKLGVEDSVGDEFALGTDLAHVGLGRVCRG
mmetsp:Transcript_33998/g.49269  ORF Transcript_33998/g.49269 Transcript_33998/m.49269 type:complete len:201 (-) Transcript_33998:91-693(-)